jgi:hypothetical protein
MPLSATNKPQATDVFVRDRSTDLIRVKGNPLYQLQTMP